MLEQGNDVKFHPRDMDETYKHMLPPSSTRRRPRCVSLFMGKSDSVGGMDQWQEQKLENR